MTTNMGLRQAAPFDTLLHFVPQLLRMLTTPQMRKVVLLSILRSEGVAMKLEQFLVKAKINAYASQGEGGEEILADGSKELTFQEGGFRYRDRYFGFNPFIGEEVVWYEGGVIWAMNYYGTVFDEVVPADQVYRFLGKAMRQVKEDRPFRGPRSFQEQDFEYIDESKGTVESFVGVERILYKGQEIYRLDYHGGSIRTG
jgi:hypothetical protein